MPRVSLIALMARSNAPLHLSLFPTTPEPSSALLLTRQQQVYCTLDIFEARLPSKPADPDFGLLYALDETLALYGWLTNTGVKIVVGIEFESGEVGRGVGVVEGELKPVFKDIQTAYVNLVCNPFYHLENDENRTITSPRFIREIRRIGESWRPQGGI